MLEIDNDISSPFGTYSLRPLQKVVDQETGEEIVQEKKEKSE